MTAVELTEMEDHVAPFVRQLARVLGNQCARVGCAGYRWRAYLDPGPPVRLRIQHGPNPEHAREFIPEPVEGVVFAAIYWATDLHAYPEHHP